MQIFDERTLACTSLRLDLLIVLPCRLQGAVRGEKGQTGEKRTAHNMEIHHVRTKSSFPPKAAHTKPTHVGTPATRATGCMSMFKWRQSWNHRTRAVVGGVGLNFICAKRDENRSNSSATNCNKKNACDKMYHQIRGRKGCLWSEQRVEMLSHSI